MHDDSMKDQVTTEQVTLNVADGTQMPAYVARPNGSGPHPGLMVFQEAFGVNAHIRDVTERFARAGFLAIAPALFHRTDPHFEGSYTDFEQVRPHMQAVTDQGLEADSKASFEWLRAGGATAVGSIGYCMGGRVSFLADSILPLAAAVSYYGGGIGPNQQGRANLLGRVGALHGPILLVWGGLDKHIDVDQRNAIEAALTAEGKPYANIVFSDADHGFFCDARASFNPAASSEAQALTLTFLANHLKH